MIKLFMCKNIYEYANGTNKNFMQIDWVTDADKKFLIEVFVHKYVEQTWVICLFWTEVLTQYNNKWQKEIIKALRRTLIYKL